MSVDSGISWVSVTTTAGKAFATSLPVPKGVWVVGASAFAFGFSNAITFEGAALTDGFPIQATTPFFISAGMFPFALAPDLMNLYLVAGGTVNVWLAWPHP